MIDLVLMVIGIQWVTTNVIHKLVGRVCDLFQLQMLPYMKITLWAGAHLD